MRKGGRNGLRIRAPLRDRACNIIASDARPAAFYCADMELDRIDHRILAELSRDGRVPNAELAQRVHLSASACLRRVQRLEEEGVIAGYHARFDPQRVGRGTLIFVEISLSSQRLDALSEFEQAVKGCPGVVECHLLSGGSDYLLRIAVASIQAYEELHQRELSRLPHVAHIRSSVVLRRVCENDALPAD